MIARLRMPALDPRDRRALRAGAWILLPLLVTALVVRPWFLAASARREATTRERALLQREQQLLAGAPGDAATFTLASRALAREAPRLFAGAEVVTASAELARYVATQAAAAGLAVRQAEMTALAGAEGAQGAADAEGTDTASLAAAGTAAARLRVTLRASGDVRAVVAFLRRMEEGAQLVRVERIDVERGMAGTSEAGALTLTATIAGLARKVLVEGGP